MYVWYGLFIYLNPLFVETFVAGMLLCKVYDGHSRNASTEGRIQLLGENGGIFCTITYRVARVLARASPAVQCSARKALEKRAYFDPFVEMSKCKSRLL
jgi:hypothetical protein